MDFEAVWLSVQLAWWTTVTLFVFGLPLAYWLAVTRWRLKFLIEAVVVLPMILPPTVLGFYILIAVGPLSPLGRTYEAMVGRSLAFSFQACGSPPSSTASLLRFDRLRRPSRAWTDTWSRRHGASACPDCIPSFASPFRSRGLEFSRG
jgi:hypothetical protein